MLDKLSLYMSRDDTFPLFYSIPTVPSGLVSTCTLGVPAFSLLNPTFLLAWSRETSFICF